MVSTVWSVSCLLFFYSRCLPQCPAICKSGGHVPSVPSWSQRHWLYRLLHQAVVQRAMISSVTITTYSSTNTCA